MSIRYRLIGQMVKNYYTQVEIVESDGSKNSVTLREYLQGIKNVSGVMTDEEVDYGCSLSR